LYQKLLRDARFYRLLARYDEDLAAEAQKASCLCGGKLHSARYPRKPRGLPDDTVVEGAYASRHSFCCAQQGCRRRMTPPSLRFLGRKVYVETVVVLVSALREGPTPTRVETLRQWTGVSKRTIARWRRWWQETFVNSPFWRAARGQLHVPVEPQRLLSSLLDRFAVTSRRKKFLGPLVSFRQACVN